MNLVRGVRVVGWLEAMSFLLLLFVAMPLKYVALQPLGVRIVGPIHGALFVGSVALVLFAARKERWDLGRITTLVVAAFLPFGPLLVDRVLRPAESPEPESEVERDGAAG